MNTKRLIQQLEERFPLAVRLAEAVSLAVIVDPPLLRRARRELLRDADPGTEADLWSSSLVQMRSPDGLVFFPEVAQVLRERLRDSGLLDNARELTRYIHGHLSPALKLEEEIAWLTVSPSPGAAERIEELLCSALAALIIGERRGLANWAARILPRLPLGLQMTETARILDAGARLRLGGDARMLHDEGAENLEWIIPNDLPRVPLQVRLLDGALELKAGSTDGNVIEIPDTDPLLIDLFWTEAEREISVRVKPWRGREITVSVPVDSVRLRTILGEVYELRAVSHLSAGQGNVAEAERRIEEARRLQLESLDLGDLTLSKLHLGLGNLPHLKALYLGVFRRTEAGELERDWDREPPAFVDLSPLAGLQALQSLDLSSTGVRDLSPLVGLQGLQILNLSSIAVTDLSPLTELQALQSLDLSNCPSVRDLSPLVGLQGLQSLNLSSTAVTDLSPLAGLQALQSLDLSITSMTDLSPLSGLQELQSLKLYGCRPAVPAELLRTLADHPRLTELVADEAVGVPREVLSHSGGDDCLPRVRTYLSELKFGIEAENEVKVILLGNGRVGKTQLCRRFRDQPFDESIESTHGVQIWREELRIQTEGHDRVFQVNWWDFGGQDIYHGTHALFLRSRAVFLILWTPGLENRDEFEENGIPLRNQPLAYWLDYVRTLAGDDSPVIVVQSQCDRFADRRPAPPRPDGLGFFEGCSYSARNDLGRDALEAHLRDAMRYLLERNGALSIGHGRAEVRRRLYNWRSGDQERKPEERRHRTLNLEEYRTLCDEAGGIASWEHALDYFHHTGVVFYRPDLFSNRIILDQTWALDAVYTVFHRGRAAPWLRDSGRFTREDLALMAWQEHSVEEQRFFLGLMESFGVCFPCGKTAQGEARYIAQDLLPKFEIVASRLFAWKEETGKPTLRLEYRFFHPAIIRGLMSEIGREVGELAEYWKYGLWFKDGRKDSQLLLQFEDTSTDEAPGAGALELKAEGGDAVGLLREIRKAIFRQRIGEQPEELLTLDGGSTVARSSLATVIGGFVLDIHGKQIPAASFTAFFEDQESRPETPVIDISPLPVTASEKPREIFISYAWGDETPEGKTRAEVVDNLYSALEKDGFRPARNRVDMRSGDQISAFIRRLTQADLVVAVISDKYLRSPYCMSEIHGLWQKSQEDAGLMAQRLVPIILPEVKIERLRDRALYVRYWIEQEKELEALLRELGPDLSLDSFRKLRLVRNFSQDVDGILRFLQNVLMPRNLEVHFEDGFQAVREALRRRVGREVLQ